MIVNLWKHIDVVCGNHPGDHTVKMGLKQGHRSLFYSCPKYYPDNRVPGELACKNHVDTVDFEKILARLSSEIEKASEFGETPNLTNLKFKVKSIEVTVLSHHDDSITIMVVNKTAIA